MIKRREPSFFSRDPRGEQCRLGIGDVVNGPDVCPRLTSFARASETSVECSVADSRLWGLVTECGAENPMSNPFVKPSTR